MKRLMRPLLLKRKSNLFATGRRPGQSSTASKHFVAKVPTSFEELDPRFKPGALAVSLLKGHNEDFARLSMDESTAFNPVRNVVNSESMLLDDSEVRSRLLESMALPRDHHLMQYREDTTEEFAQNFCRSLTVVSSCC